jgi:hypothetical protein
MRILMSSKVAVIALFSALCVLSSTPVLAEESSHYKGDGFVYYGAAAPMSDSGAINYPLGIGGGGDFFLIRGLAAGADFGYYTNPKYRDVNFKLFSANVSYHFKNRTQFHRVDPYVAGGWGLFNARSNSNWGFFGFGLDTWVHRRYGVRFEARIYGHSNDALGTFRVAFVLR